MAKNKLKQVKQMIRGLSSEEKQQIVPFLAELPDSGVKTYDLKEEIDTLKKHGTKLASPDDDPDRFLVGLTFIRNLVSVQIHDTDVLVAMFFPDNFIEAYPKQHAQVAVHSEGYRKVFTTERREQERAMLKAQGIEQTDAEYEEDIKKRCDAAAELWITEKAKRVADQISRHLPGMVGDMMAAAIKGQTFYDFYNAF